MWAHFWILGLFQPLTHYRGAIPGFQASEGTAGAIFVASARQLQHLIFVYQRNHSLAPPTITIHAPVLIAAIALTQIRRVSNRAQKFERLLWLFADLAVTFRRLRDLLQSLALKGYEAGFVDSEKFNELFERFADACKAGRRGSPTTEFSFGSNAEENRRMAAILRGSSYDTHFATTHVIDEIEDGERLY